MVASRMGGLRDATMLDPAAGLDISAVRSRIVGNTETMQKQIVES